MHTDAIHEVLYRMEKLHMDSMSMHVVRHGGKDVLVPDNGRPCSVKGDTSAKKRDMCVHLTCTTMQQRKSREASNSTGNTIHRYQQQQSTIVATLIYAGSSATFIKAVTLNSDSIHTNSIILTYPPSSSP